MKEVCVFMTDKQIEYVKDYSGIKKVSFNEGLRQIIDGYQKNERLAANERATEAFK